MDDDEEQSDGASDGQCRLFLRFVAGVGIWNERIVEVGKFGQEDRIYEILHLVCSHTVDGDLVGDVPTDGLVFNVPIGDVPTDIDWLLMFQSVMFRLIVGLLMF